MELRGVVRAQLAQPVGGGIESPVGLAVLDSGHCGFTLQAELVLDGVGEAVRLGVVAPFLEVRVADQVDVVVRVIGLQDVGAGAGYGGAAGILLRGVGRKDAGVRKREFGEELRVGSGEADSDGAALGLDAIEGAGSRGAEAGFGALDGAIERLGGRAADAEQAAEAGRNVRGSDKGAGAEADTGAEAEAP